MKKLVNIMFQSGTHGHYLRFCIDKFSSLTPEFPGTPFTENGTSHSELNYSGLVNLYHHWDDIPYSKDIEDPYILITIDKDDVLFLERWTTIRSRDSKIDLNNDYVKWSNKFLDLLRWKDKLANYYNVDLEKHKIPRFVIRDFYKLTFLDIENNGYVKIDKRLRDNKPKNAFEFPISSFWDKHKFKETLEKLNRSLDLRIDTDNCVQTHDLFLKNLNFIDTRHRANEVIQAIRDRRDMPTHNLDTVEQAYVSAWIEQNHDYVQVPVCNQFFQSTNEIITWLAHYPQHYKAMNPNLPTFNNIPNPYYLWNPKK
jgi:hypothetical protein